MEYDGTDRCENGEWTQYFAVNFKKWLIFVLLVGSLIVLVLQRHLALGVKTQVDLIVCVHCIPRNHLLSATPAQVSAVSISADLDLLFPLTLSISGSLWYRLHTLSAIQTWRYKKNINPLSWTNYPIEAFVCHTHIPKMKSVKNSLLVLLHCAFTMYRPRVHSINQWWSLCIKGDGFSLG